VSRFCIQYTLFQCLDASVLTLSSLVLHNSGTEPKFKYYLELRGRPGESRDDVEKRLRKMSGVILEELVRPREQGLILPSSL